MCRFIWSRTLLCVLYWWPLPLLLLDKLGHEFILYPIGNYPGVLVECREFRPSFISSFVAIIVVLIIGFLMLTIVITLWSKHVGWAWLLCIITDVLYVFVFICIRIKEMKGLVVKLAILQ